MAYDHAIELFFDEAADAKIRRAWTDISREAGLPDKMGERGERPHISLGVFGPAKIDPLLAGLKALAAAQASFEVRLHSLGFFGDAAAVVFFAPVPNQQLLALHKKCFESLNGLVEGWEGYYLPEKLTFHCTINLGLTREQAGKAAAAGLKIPLPIDARAVQIALLKIEPREVLGAFDLT